MRGEAVLESKGTCSSSELGTLEESLERERAILRGGYTNVFCFAVSSSLGVSNVGVLFTGIRSLPGEDDVDGGIELGGVGVLGWVGSWKTGGRKVSC